MNARSAPINSGLIRDSSPGSAVGVFVIEVGIRIQRISSQTGWITLGE
ncbi:MAG: hypothetical protein WCF12_09620 [Propionicimonas sp.]